jgi:chromosome segregation ATPase
MRPVEFSIESILQAGQALQAAGRNVTGFALRQKVGGGNPGRLKQVWDEHLASQAAPAEPAAELPVDVAAAVAALSQELASRLALLAVELNDKAVKASEQRTAEVVRAAGLQRAQADRELIDAAQTVDDLEAKLDTALAAVGALQTRLAETHASWQAQAVELAARTAQAQAAQQAHQDLRQRAEQCEAEREQARRDAGAAREEAAHLRGQVAAMQAQAAELRRALAAK